MSSWQLVRLPGVEITQEGSSQDPGVKNTETRDKTRSFVSGGTGQDFDILTRLPSGGTVSQDSRALKELLTNLT